MVMRASSAGLKCRDRVGRIFSARVSGSGPVDAQVLDLFGGQVVQQHHSVGKIDLPPLAVGQAALVEDLIENVHHVQVGFLHFIEQHHRIRTLAHLASVNMPPSPKPT
jgi:hypothetical protein